MVEIPKRYEPRRVLGAGGMGRVELVFDRERGQEVALKLLTASNDEARFLFKQEFWAMASLRHPNLVEAFDFGGDSFTMEIVPGADLEPPQTEAEVRAWLPGVAAALGFLHGRGWVHGDLKPQNLRPPKLMDLGLMERAGRPGGAIRGTPSYMAPEVIRQGALDARTDLYSLGAVLYHLLSGKPPFEAEQPLALLRAHLMDAPRPLTGVSAAMAAAVQKLLAKEPSARFPSAAALMRALGLAAAEEGAQLLAPPLVGRAGQQVALGDLVGYRGPAHRVLAGPAGSGKTRLLAELRAEAQLAGVRVLAARGLGEDAAPYEALLPWLRALAPVPRLAPVLIKLLPDLPRLWGLGAVAPAPALEGAQERRRLEAAIVELAQADVQDALWILDDADRVDPASRALVEALRRAGGDRPWRWVEAVAEAPAPALALPPLTEAETLEVARGLLGQDDLPAALVERLPALAEGVPGTIENLVTHWVRQGDLQGARGRWEANPAAGFALPSGLGALPVEGVGEDALHVARVAALLGDEGDLPILAALVAWPEERFYAALTELNGILIQGEGARYGFASRPALSSRLAASLEPVEAAALHRRAADLLAHGEGPEDATRPLTTALAIAQHLLAAGEPAAPWVLAAARRALGLGEVARAAGLLHRALAQGGPDLALQRMLADALRYDGRIDEALALATDAIVPALRASGDPALGHELATLGLLHQIQGRYDEARAAFEEAIEQGDVATRVRARTSLGRVSYFGGDAVAARELLAQATRDARAAGLETQLAGALGLYGYLIGATDASRVEEALGVLDEAVAANRAIGDAVEELEALNLRGNLLLATGRLQGAEAAFTAGLAVSQRLGLANEEVFAHLNLGAVALERGRPAAARLHGHQAAELAERQGRKFPLSFARAVEGLARVLEGDLAGGQALLAEGLALAREINNRYVELAIQAYTAEALVELGRFAEAAEALLAARALAEATGNDEQQARLARVGLALAALDGEAEPEAQHDPYALRWRAAWLLRQGRHLEAAGVAADAVALAREAGLALLEAGARLVAGRVALALGDEAVAQAALEEGLALAEDAGHRALALALQQALDPLGPAGAELAALAAGLPPAHEHAFLAHPERAGHAPAPDRLSQLAGLQASVSAEGGLAEVMHRAIAALVALADADRGFLFLYDGTGFTDQVFYGMAEHEADAYSGSLAFKALWSETPIWVEDAQVDPEFQAAQSIQALALRSVLGVPLIEGGRAIGVMLADSRRVNQRFGPQDLELVEVLAGHVALAIAQARRVEQLTREKEQLAIVARTATAMIGIHDLPAAFRAVAAEALALTGAERALFLWGPDLEVLACEGPAGAPSASAAGWVREHGEPLHLLDASSDEAFKAAQSIQALGLRTILAVPVGDRAGVLYLDDRRITDRDDHVMGTLAHLGQLLAVFMRSP